MDTFFHFFLAFTLLFPHSAFAISFYFSKFDQDNTNPSTTCPTGIEKMCLHGDASVDPNKSIIQLTRIPNSGSDYRSGSAFYSEPLHLWDNTTGQVLLANFTTTFSINIEQINPNQTTIADGIIFFLSPPPFQFMTGGGKFGLVNDSSASDYQSSSSNSFVAIEFDTYRNEWDPVTPHVAIDVGSIYSEDIAIINSATSNISGDARLDYDSLSRKLSVSLSCFGSTYTLSRVIDLSLVLPEFVVVGFSGTTGLFAERNQIISWSFNSTSDVIFKAARDLPSEGKKFKTYVVIIIVALALFVVVLGLVVVLSLVWWRRNRTSYRQREDHDDEQHAIILDERIAIRHGPRRFVFQHLVDATRNFEDGRKLGAGGSGTVYRAFMEELNCEVAIKRITNVNPTQGRKLYLAEVEVISQLRHRNLVQLIGWSEKKGEFLLVYELMTNLSLDRHLLGVDKILPWNVRYNIALGVASALLYLHEEWHRCVVHRDIKSSNIMLDDDFNAKVGDFGLARLANHGSSLQTTRFGGTMGYISPEYFYTGKASRESDIYAFGVVALQIATGRKSFHETIGNEEGVHLVYWVWKLYERGEILEAADHKLDMNFDSHQMECLLLVGLWCAHPDADHRPTIRKAVGALNFEDVKINLPLKMPKTKYEIPYSSSTQVPSPSNNLNV